jgi:hypothetical protein
LQHFACGGLPPVQPHTVPPGSRSVVAVQVPFWHLSTVHGLLLFSQIVSLGLFCSTHSPDAGTHTFCLHWFVCAGQVFCGPAVQTPFWHVSSVQRFWSRSQGVSFGCFTSFGH